MPERLKFEGLPRGWTFDPSQYAHLLTKEPPPPPAAAPPAPRRHPLYQAGEWMSKAGNAADMGTTLDFLFHGHTEHNPLFGARPNPWAITAAKAGNDAFNRWLMKQMVEQGELPEWLAGIYGIVSGLLPLKAGITNIE